MGVINLTFYSGKIWHSDKPFPVREHFHSLSFEDNQKLYLNHIKENWLSTAYEVVNPEVIPGMDDYFSGYTKPVDGDQITLPDGYGIRYTINGPKVATITRPEKPENSAHGCPKCRTTDFNSCHSMYCAMRKESVAEPSESQEEMWGQVINDARWYDGSPVKHKALLDHFKEKFTITRK